MQGDGRRRTRAVIINSQAKHHGRGLLDDLDGEVLAVLPFMGEGAESIHG